MCDHIDIAEKECIICLEVCAPHELTKLKCLASCDLVIHSACMKKYLRHSEGHICPICRGSLSDNAHTRAVRLAYQLARTLYRDDSLALGIAIVCVALLITASVAAMLVYCPLCQPGTDVGFSDSTMATSTSMPVTHD